MSDEETVRVLAVALGFAKTTDAVSVRCEPYKKRKGCTFASLVVNGDTKLPKVCDALRAGVIGQPSKSAEVAVSMLAGVLRASVLYEAEAAEKEAQIHQDAADKAEADTVAIAHRYEAARSRNRATVLRAALASL